MNVPEGRSSSKDQLCKQRERSKPGQVSPDYSWSSRVKLRKICTCPQNKETSLRPSKVFQIANLLTKPYLSIARTSVYCSWAVSAELSTRILSTIGSKKNQPRVLLWLDRPKALIWLKLDETSCFIYSRLPSAYCKSVVIIRGLIGELRTSEALSGPEICRHSRVSAVSGWGRCCLSNWQ